MSLVIIPQGYEDLPKAKQAQVIPICIDGCDEHGQEIDQRWFTKGVTPAYQWLLRLSHRVLGDALRASEITERAVHALWRINGSNLGSNPPAQVAAKAHWAAKDVKSEKTRFERNSLLSIFSERKRDRTDYQRVYEAKLDLDLMLKRMRDYGYDLETITNGLLYGYTYEAIAEELGLNVKTVNKRIQRWRRKEHALLAHGLQRRCRTSSAGADGSSAEELSKPES